MRIIGIMKSKESYNRLKYHFSDERLEWEDYINQLEELQGRISFVEYDLAIIDQNVWWKDEASELLIKFGVEIVLFEGDFEEVINIISEALPPIEEEKLPLEEFEADKQEEFIDDRPIRYIEKEVIVEKTIKIKVPEYQQVYTNIPNKLILIGNLSKRAGSTFITLNLAKTLAERQILTGVIEPPIDKPYIFDTIDLEARLDKTEEEESIYFYSYPHEIANKEKILANRETIEEGIVWNVPDPRKPLINKWTYENMMKLIYTNRKSSINILDVGDNLFHESIEPILGEADHVLVIVDPLPTEIMQNSKKLDSLLKAKDNGIPIDFLINRWSKSLEKHKEDVILRIKSKPITFIPNVDSNLIYKSIWQRNIPYSYKEVKEQIEMKFNEIIRFLSLADFNMEEDVETRGIKHLFRFLKKGD